MTEKKQIQRDAVIVGMAERGGELPALERSLDELARLLDTAGSRVFARVTAGIRRQLREQTNAGAFTQNGNVFPRHLRRSSALP